MSATEVVKAADVRPLGAVERVLIGGDLSALNEQDRLLYYKATCESLGLNPLTKPFDYMELDGKLILYAKRDCTDQLRKVNKISIKIVARDLTDGVYTVTSRATTPEGREDESIGAVPLVKEGGQWKTSQGGKKFFEPNGEMNQLRPVDRANAMMKAETKAKRRVTLSICGLGIPDESELEDRDGFAVLRKEAELIDTGGHAVGSREAAEHVAQSKITCASPAGAAAASVPNELAAALAAIDKTDQAFLTACEVLQKRMFEVAGAEGEKAYDAIASKFNEKYPEGTTDKKAMKDRLTEIWNASRKLDPPADTGKPADSAPAAPRPKFDLGRKK